MSPDNASRRVSAWRLWRRNGIIWISLLLLLILSLALAYVPMGVFTLTAGIVIAFVKAGLVVLLFMELAKSKPLIQLAAVSGAVFLTALFALTLADVLTRLVGG
ncbi:cytochrome C oxidase subunit IV family protein [Bradyrhizobium genosp. P]|uniref:cytochrome C oxidase subunit IV family protein n=1 Tax=Bradyrhizobium genosp. P TaxID=83641 RepID=UPI003CF929C3